MLKKEKKTEAEKSRRFKRKNNQNIVHKTHSVIFVRVFNDMLVFFRINYEEVGLEGGVGE